MLLAAVTFNALCVPAPAGLSASNIAPQTWFWLPVAEPLPVVPAVAFVAQPAPTLPLPFEVPPYRAVRLPGEVVENVENVLLSNPAASINTAAFGLAVVIAVTPEIDVPEPVVKLPGVTSKTELSTPEKATMAPAAPSALVLPNETV